MNVYVETNTPGHKVSSNSRYRNIKAYMIPHIEKKMIDLIKFSFGHGQTNLLVD